MYEIMASISMYLRQFHTPNPFESLGDYAVVYNWIAEPFIQIINYSVVGFYYTKGSNPFLGSLLYLLFYWVHIGVLLLMSDFGFEPFWIGSIFIAYVSLHIGFNILKNKIMYRSVY